MYVCDNEIHLKSSFHWSFRPDRIFLNAASVKLNSSNWCNTHTHTQSIKSHPELFLCHFLRPSMNLRSSSTRNVHMTISRPLTVTATQQPSWVDCAAARSQNPWSPRATRCTSVSSPTPRYRGRASRRHTPQVWTWWTHSLYITRRSECALRNPQSPGRYRQNSLTSPSSGSQQHSQHETVSHCQISSLFSSPLRVWRSSESRCSPEEPLLPCSVWGQQLSRSQWLWVADNCRAGLRHRAELHYVWGGGGSRLWLRLHRAVQRLRHQLTSSGALLRFRGETCFCCLCQGMKGMYTSRGFVGMFVDF